MLGQRGAIGAGGQHGFWGEGLELGKPMTMGFALSQGVEGCREGQQDLRHAEVRTVREGRALQRYLSIPPPDKARYPGANSM